MPNHYQKLTALENLRFFGAFYDRPLLDPMLKVGLLLIPTILPFLNFFGITDTWWWYIIPVQGALILLEASMGVEFTDWEISYSVSYLLLACIVSFRWALRLFTRKTTE